MPKIHSPAAAATVSTRTMTTRTLVFCALLAAMQVVLARLIVPMPAADVRFSIEAVPVFLAGALFGPVPGALVGFGSDMIGCLFSGYGYNPIFALPPILYGSAARRPSSACFWHFCPPWFWALSSTRARPLPMSIPRTAFLWWHFSPVWPPAACNLP